MNDTTTTATDAPGRREAPDLALSRSRIDRSLLSTQVFEELRRTIVEGTLRPGDRMVELEISRRLGVSQSTTREALRQLVRAGLAVQIPRRGTYVATADVERAWHAYRVRIALEPIAATGFCAEASDEAVEELRGLFNQMKADAAAGDLAAFVERDNAFHATIWSASGNPVLPQVWTMIEGSFRALTVWSNPLVFADLAEVAETHGPLLDALAKRDARTSSRLLTEHARFVWKQIHRP